AVLGAGQREAAIGRYRDAEWALGVALEADQFLAGRGIPQPHRWVAVDAAAQHALAVGRERRALAALAVTLEPRQLLAGGDVPDADGPVEGRRRQALAVAGKGHARDGGLVPL